MGRAVEAAMESEGVEMWEEECRRRGMRSKWRCAIRSRRSRPDGSSSGRGSSEVEDSSHLEVGENMAAQVGLLRAMLRRETRMLTACEVDGEVGTGAEVSTSASLGV